MSALHLQEVIHSWASALPFHGVYLLGGNACICYTTVTSSYCSKRVQLLLSWELQSPYVHLRRYNYSPLKARSSSSVHIKLNSTGDVLIGRNTLSPRANTTCDVRHDVLSFDSKPAPKTTGSQSCLFGFEAIRSEIANHTCLCPATDMCLSMHTRQT